MVRIGAVRFTIARFRIALSENPFYYCVVLVDGDSPRTTDVSNPYVLELNLKVCGDGAATSEEGDVLQQALSSLPDAGRADGHDLQRAADLVHD
jgi:hypothetical protein